MNRRTQAQVLAVGWLAVAATLIAAACGSGTLTILRPPDGGPAPLPDGGWPDAGQDPPGPPDQVRTTLEVTPTNLVVADGVSRAVLRVTVRDATGRTLPGVNVSFSATGQGNTFLPAAARGTTGSDGSTSVALASTRAEAKTVTAALAAFSLTTQVTFVPGPPSLSHSELQLAPSSLVADGTESATMLVTLKDRSGNFVVGHDVFFDATGTNNTFAPSPAIVRSGTDGTAQASLASTRAEAKTVVATVSSAFVFTQPVTFRHGPASLAASSIVASPTVMVADGVDATTVRVVLRDQHGNPLPGQVVVFSVSPSNEATNPSMPTTNVDGEVTTTFRSTIAETKTITALAAGLTLRATVRFGPGTPSGTPSTLTANPASLLADGMQTTLLTVSLKDGAGNPVPNEPVSFSATGSANRFMPDPPSGMTDAAGVFTARLSSTVAEAKTVFATTAAFSLSTPVTFTIGPPSQGDSRFSATPQQVVANGTDTTSLTVVVRDAFGNPVPGQAVTFSSTGTGNTITPASATTNAAGSASATLRSTRAELKTVTATFAGLMLQTSVSFVPGPPSQSRSTLVASPSRFTTDNSPGTTITATIRDASGNPLPGRTVDVTASGTNNSWSSAPSGETDTSGTFSVQMSSANVGSQTITATCEALTMNTSVQVDPGAPSLVFMNVNPGQLRADGVQSTVVTVYASDFHDNPIPGLSVSFEVDGTENTWLDPRQGVTNAQGQFSARLASTMPEWKQVTGHVAGLDLLGFVLFTP